MTSVSSKHREFFTAILAFAGLSSLALLHSSCYAPAPGSGIEYTGGSAQTRHANSQGKQAPPSSDASDNTDDDSKIIGKTTYTDRPKTPQAPAAPPAPAPPSPPPSSQGSGGRMGLVEETFTDSNGVRSTYKINAPQDAGSSIYGLHIHLHGDGGGGYRDYPNQSTRDQLIGVTVKAPNQNLQWGRQEGVRHAQYLQDLIQNELLRKYNIDLAKVFFSGVSGGAYFLAGHFIPMFGKDYRSGALLLCGGMPPSVNFQSPEFLGRFRIHWQVTAGERQDIMQSIEPAIRAYQNALRQVGGSDAMQTSEIAGQGGHCEFDGRAYTSGIQYIIDQKFRLILP